VRKNSVDSKKNVAKSKVSEIWALYGTVLTVRDPSTMTW